MRADSNSSAKALKTKLTWKPWHTKGHRALDSESHQIDSLLKQKHQHFPEDLNRTQRLKTKHSKCPGYYLILLNIQRTRDNLNYFHGNIINRFQSQDDLDVGDNRQRL